MENKDALFLVTPPPHIRTNESTRSIMINVLLALLPAIVVSWYFFGVRALMLVLVSIASAITFEYLSRLAMNRMSTVSDFSAVVTGVLLALSLPVTVPIWLVVIGNFFAIVIVKQLFGGIGQNFVNPALTAHIFLYVSFNSFMTTYVDPVRNFSGNYDLANIVSTATPLASFKQSGSTANNLFQAFLGNTGGTIGETSAALLILGGIYLLAKKIIRWQTPVAYLGTVAICAFLYGGASLNYTAMQLCSGGLMLGAFFMATDYSTTPVTNKGRLIFGIGCGLLTCFIRFYGVYIEGVSFAIVAMNLFTWLIDRKTIKIKGGAVNV